jgi:DNA-binding response OmpR family regulator
MDHEFKQKSPLAKVLVVDDDRQLLWALNTRLAQIGCECTVCANASEAMVQFASIGFDLVITDLTMPGIDGLAVIAMIRSQSPIPILVVTGHSREYGAAVAAYKNVTLVHKPLEPRVLIALVRSCLLRKLDPDGRLKCG